MSKQERDQQKQEPKKVRRYTPIYYFRLTFDEFTEEGTRDDQLSPSAGDQVGQSVPRLQPDAQIDSQRQGATCHPRAQHTAAAVCRC